MNLRDLRKQGLLYVATPFTLYEAGLNAAFIDACRLMADLARLKVFNAISPIVEAYPISYHGNLDPLDLDIWKPFCAARMAKSDALVVGMLKGWERSSGTLHEIQTFIRADKPFYFLDPVRLYLETPTTEQRQQFLREGAAA